MDEFGLIRTYFADWPADDRVRLGVGDDAAVLALSTGQEWVVCTDTLVLGRHFSESCAPSAIGHKALAVNLSDLAAMGAEPHSFLLALTLPEASPDWLREFASGLRALAQEAGVALVGGDTTRGPLSITITALGLVPSGTALQRRGARPGDEIAVSGTLGDAALALELGDQAPERLRARLDRPVPRLSLGRWLRGRASAAIDVSDGLAQDLGHLLAASDVAAELNVGELPTSAEFRKWAAAEDAHRLQLAGGDDYELCFTASPEQMKAILAEAPMPIARIGRILPAQRNAPRLLVRDADGATIATPTTGFLHF